MVRDIKFRVWNVRLKGWTCCTQHLVHIRSEQILKVTPEQGASFLFEQYIGLNDRSGREVYEGDIVRGIASSTAIEENVKFIGFVKWDDEDLGFYFESDGNWPHIKPWFVKSFEIIGNIHENKGLLEN